MVRDDSLPYQVLTAYYDSTAYHLDPETSECEIDLLASSTKSTPGDNLCRMFFLYPSIPPSTPFKIQITHFFSS